MLKIGLMANDAYFSYAVAKRVRDTLKEAYDVSVELVYHSAIPDPFEYAQVSSKKAFIEKRKADARKAVHEEWRIESRGEHRPDVALIVETPFEPLAEVYQLMNPLARLKHMTGTHRYVIKSYRKEDVGRYDLIYAIVSPVVRLVNASILEIFERKLELAMRLAKMARAYRDVRIVPHELHRNTADFVTAAIADRIVTAQG